MANTFNAITTGTGGIATTGDASGAFSFTKDGGSAEVYIDSSGNVGIGSSSTYGYKVFIQGSSGAGLGVFDGTNTGYILGNGSTMQFGTPNSIPVAFNTAGTERMRIASDGTITSTLGGMQVRSGTAVASTSGTSIDFTSIPSWVKRITVMFNGVSTSGTSNFQVQLGDSGGIENTSYVAYGANTTASAIGGTAYTTGFGIRYDTAASLMSGAMTIINVSGNIWVSTHNLVGSTTTNGYYGAGNKTLSDVLDRIRITTINGTDTFDAGTINIIYE